MWIKKANTALQDTNVLINLETGSKISLFKGEYVEKLNTKNEVVYERNYGVVLYTYGFNAEGDACQVDEYILPVKYSRAYANSVIEKLAKKLGAVKLSEE